MNEARFIRYLRARAPRGGLRVGIGDDAAVVRGAGRTDWILKADMVVEGVHFERSTSRPRDWGRKAVLCNVSDIAAMGGTPRYALVSAGFPRNFPPRGAEAAARGILEALAEFGVVLAGGDTTRSDRVVLSVAMVGEVGRGRAVTRAGARAGDVIFVTGPLGGSLRSGRHLRFVPRLAESRYLVSRYRVHAMIDVSDGLSKDLGHLAEESGVGLRVFDAAVPLSRATASVEAAFTDGEDFELVFTVSGGDARRLAADRLARKKGFAFYPIGRVVPKRLGRRRVTAEGRLKPFPRARDHHFG